MKIPYLQLITATFLVSSCGTSAYYSSNSYGDAVYDAGSPSKIYVAPSHRADSRELSDLRQKTLLVRNITINKNKDSVLIVSQDSLLGDTTVSYTELLTKFDFPVYIVDDYNPWEYGYSSWNPWFNYRMMDYRFGYNPYFRFGWDYSFYDPWYGPYSYWNYPYYSYWNSPWYNPWYYSWNYGWNSPYYYGWYYDRFWPSYPEGRINNRNTFYGKRDQYNDHGTYAGGARSGGSYTRRSLSMPLQMHQTSGNTVRSSGVYSRQDTRNERSGGQSQSPVYRRSSFGRQSSSNTQTRSNYNRQQSQPVYNNTSGTYNRNSTPPPASSNSGNSNSSSGSTTRSGGSVYRR